MQPPDLRHPPAHWKAAALALPWAPDSSAMLIPAGRRVTCWLSVCQAPIYLGCVGKLGFVKQQLSAHHPASSLA